MEIEQAFDIRMPDEECEKVYTVGDLQELVLKYINGSSVESCASSFVFYKLRRSFENVFGTTKAEFAPQVQLESIVPVKNRKTSWNDLQTHSGFQLPELEKPNWYTNIQLLFGFVSIVVVITSMMTGSVLQTLGYLIGFGVFFYVIAKATEPLRKYLPFNVGETVVKTRNLNFKQISKERQTSANEIKSIVAHIIANKLGVDIIEVTAEAILTDDLGMD